MRPAQHGITRVNILNSSELAVSALCWQWGKGADHQVVDWVVRDVAVGEAGVVDAGDDRVFGAQ